MFWGVAWLVDHQFVAVELKSYAILAMPFYDFSLHDIFAFGNCRLFFWFNILLISSIWYSKYIQIWFIRFLSCSKQEVQIILFFSIYLSEWQSAETFLNCDTRKAKKKFFFSNLITFSSNSMNKIEILRPKFRNELLENKVPSQMEHSLKFHPVFIVELLRFVTFM